MNRRLSKLFCCNLALLLTGCGQQADSISTDSVGIQSVPVDMIQYDKTTITTLEDIDLNTSEIAYEVMSEPVIIYNNDNYDSFEHSTHNTVDSGKNELIFDLKNAINENSKNKFVLYAIKIEPFWYKDLENVGVYSYTSDNFLLEYNINGYTYSEIDEKRREIGNEIKRLTEISDLCHNSTLTEEQVAEYSNRISELTNEDQYYYEVSMDILYAAEQYLLQLEIDKLKEHGIDVCGITENKRNTNYIIAIASAEEINSMPFSDDVGYKIGLAPKT